MQSAWRALLEDIELMPQDQDLGFQPSTRLEAIAQHADEEEANCYHQSHSCSDSFVAVTPVDGVFGRDRDTVPRYLAATAQAIYGSVGIGGATALVTIISGWLYAL